MKKGAQLFWSVNSIRFSEQATEGEIGLFVWFLFVSTGFPPELQSGEYSVHIFVVQEATKIVLFGLQKIFCFCQDVSFSGWRPKLHLDVSIQK